jgi:hypothetical protein
MPPGKLKVQARVTAWWLSGDELCAHCGQLYAYEVEFRCPECDSPSCPHCRIKHSKGHHVCITCVDVAEESEHG